MSTPKRNKSSIIRSDDEDDPVRVEMHGFYWPRLLVKQSPNEKKRPTIKIPRRLKQADKKSKALLLRQLIKNSKVSSTSLATVPVSVPPMLPSLDRSLTSLGLDQSFSANLTASTFKTTSSWSPSSSTGPVTNISSRVTGNLWPHRVPVMFDENHFGYVLTDERRAAITTFSSLPSSPTSIMGHSHHLHSHSPSRPRAVTMDAN
jgi:hypothetical protein